VTYVLLMATLEFGHPVALVILVVSRDCSVHDHTPLAYVGAGAARMASAHEDLGKIGMPIAGDDKNAIEVASRLVQEAGFELVVVGGLDMGRYLMAGTPLAGEHTPPR
jgi:hypothetical protein